jgi:SAM-dependent methyltransferase
VSRADPPADSRTTVRAGYDAIAEAYLDWGSRVVGDPRDRFVEDLAARLPDGAAVLDLGCGAGLPSTRRLAERFEVVGVDASERQIDLARANVPGASFIRADLSEVRFEDGTFAAVTALYSISHLPRVEHGALFERIASWLGPGGLFLASLGSTDSPDWTGKWLGVPMFFSSYDAAMNRGLVESAGFVPLHAEVVTMTEPDGEVAFLWMLAQKPAH